MFHFYVCVVVLHCDCPALHIAIQEGWGNVVTYLIDVNSNIHLTNAVGRTPLHIAATVGRCDMGAHLLAKKALPGVVDSLGWTPRQTAEFHKYSDFCELCIRAEMVDKQYSMKDVPPGDWDTPLWQEVLSSYHEKKTQIDKESRRFEKKITRGSSMLGSLPDSLFTADDSMSATTNGDNSTVISESFDTLSRKKKAQEGISRIAAAAKRNVEFRC